MKVSNESTASCRRIVWVAFTKFSTLLIPDCFLIHCAGLQTRGKIILKINIVYIYISLY
jgi:hypothetical protein